MQYKKNDRNAQNAPCNGTIEKIGGSERKQNDLKMHEMHEFR